MKLESDSAQSVKSKLEREKAMCQHTRVQRVTLDMQSKSASEDIRHLIDDISQEGKLLDRKKRDHKKREAFFYFFSKIFKRLNVLNVLIGNLNVICCCQKIFVPKKK